MSSSPSQDVKKRKISDKPRDLRRIRFKQFRKYSGMKFYEVRGILDTNEIVFCQKVGLLASSVTCSCGKPMKLMPRCDARYVRNTFVWCCHSYSNKENPHKHILSVRKGTWFEKSCLRFSEILWLAYMWVYEYSYNSILHECGQHKKETVDEWLTSFSEVCQAILEEKSEPLGGIDKIVEIFECKVDEASEKWVFCALEHGTCKSVLVIMQDIKSKSLVQLFDKYVINGSTVLTNLWSSFKEITEVDFSHLLQEKCITFYDDVTKEGIINVSMMRKIASRPPAINAYTKYKYDIKFCETIYRKSLLFAKDAYVTYLQDVARVYRPVDKYVKNQDKDR